MRLCQIANLLYSRRRKSAVSIVKARAEIEFRPGVIFENTENSYFTFSFAAAEASARYFPFSSAISSTVLVLRLNPFTGR